MDPRLEQLANNLYNLNPAIQPAIQRLTVKATNTTYNGNGPRMQVNDPDAALLINYMANWGAQHGQLNAVGAQAFRNTAMTAYNSFAMNPRASNMWNADPVGENPNNPLFRISDVVKMYELALQGQPGGHVGGVPVKPVGGVGGGLVRPVGGVGGGLVRPGGAGGGNVNRNGNINGNGNWNWNWGWNWGNGNGNVGGNGGGGVNVGAAGNEDNGGRFGDGGVNVGAAGNEDNGGRFQVVPDDEMNGFREWQQWLLDHPPEPFRGDIPEQDPNEGIA